MHKEVEEKEDGRCIIYYTFPEDARDEKNMKLPENSPAKTREDERCQS